MGLCARAAGYGYKVLIYQFMKNNKTSERKILEAVENITWISGLDQEKIQFPDDRGGESRAADFLW